MVKVKICGITNARDAKVALRAGADAIGFVFAESPRKVAPEEARRLARLAAPDVLTVGVFVNESTERMLRIGERCSLGAVQLHGDEKPSTVRRMQKNGFRVLQAFRALGPEDIKKAEDSPADAVLFDTAALGRFGGTGRTFDWKILKGKQIRLPWFVSGGLNPENIQELLSVLKPYGVDVSSGVERAPGKKSGKKVREFITNAKSTR